MQRMWFALALAAGALTLLLAGCQEAAQDATKGGKNAAGLAQKMHQSGSGEGGGDATSDD
jgi:hypothetical protein